MDVVSVVRAREGPMTSVAATQEIGILDPGPPFLPHNRQSELGWEMGQKLGERKAQDQGCA